MKPVKIVSTFDYKLYFEDSIYMRDPLISRLQDFLTSHSYILVEKEMGFRHVAKYGVATHEELLKVVKLAAFSQAQIEKFAEMVVDVFPLIDLYNNTDEYGEILEFDLGLFSKVVDKFWEAVDFYDYDMNVDNVLYYTPYLSDERLAGLFKKDTDWEVVTQYRMNKITEQFIYAEKYLGKEEMQRRFELILPALRESGRLEIYQDIFIKHGLMSDTDTDDTAVKKAKKK